MTGPSRAARRRRSLTAGGLASAALAVAAALPSSASADFTTGACEGAAMIGRGASFAASAHNQYWIPTALQGFCFPFGSVPTVSYNSTGSGSGRRVMGERTNGTPEGDNEDGSKSRSEAPRFGMSEEPPSVQGQADINRGTDAAGDEGNMRLVPGANGAVAIAVNIPNGCVVDELPDGSIATTILSNPDLPDRRRLRLTRSQLEQAFNGDADMDTWGELVPTINDGNNTPAEASDTRCQAFPLVRIRRLDDGGTTFAFKDYLDKLNPGRGWLTTYVTPNTRTWPNHTRGTAFDYNSDGDTTDAIAACAAQYEPWTTTYPDPDGVGAEIAGGRCLESDVPLLQTSQIAGPSGNGNDDLINKVNDFDGTIGYGDLSTVRQQRSFAFERQAGGDDKYWVQIQHGNVASAVYDDPQSAPDGYVAGGARGSNCSLAQVRNIPGGSDPTLANWEAVSAVDSPQGFGICTLTYFIVFDDYSGPYSARPDQIAEERQARTVRDYVQAATAVGGQNGLSSFDYSPLPLAVQQIAATAAQAIGWRKTAGGGGGGGGGGTPPPGGGPPGGDPPASPPSNAFTIASRRVSGKSIVLAIQIPGAGSVRATATARLGRRSAAIGSAAATRASGGTVRLTIKASARAKRELKRKRKLKVSVAVAFTPQGGTEAGRRASVTLRQRGR